MSDPILYQDEKRNLYTVKSKAIDRNRIAHLKNKNLIKTDIQELIRDLAMRYGLHPENLNIFLFTPVSSETKDYKIATSHYRDNSLTNQIRKGIKNYVNSCTDAYLSSYIFKIRNIEKEFGINSEKYRTIINLLKETILHEKAISNLLANN